jgi:hypothetical protein
MTLDVMGVFGDAWRLWKRDRELLLGFAGFFLFLPHLATKMFIPALPAFPDMRDRAAFRAWLDAAQSWYGQYSLIILLFSLVILFGTLAIFTLYLDPERPDGRAALGRALRLSPRFLLAAILVSLPVQLGLLFLFLPGFYVQGRLLVALPALVAERPIGAGRAMSRSLMLTRGNGLVLAGFGCIVLIAGYVLASPFETMGKTLDGAPMANPVVAALLDAASAAGLTMGIVAGILIQVALYRRLVQPNSGI